MPVPRPLLDAGRQGRPQTEPAATGQQQPSRVQRRLGRKRRRTCRFPAADQLCRNQRPGRVAVSLVRRDALQARALPGDDERTDLDLAVPQDDPDVRRVVAHPGRRSSGMQSMCGEHDDGIHGCVRRRDERGVDPEVVQSVPDLRRVSGGWVIGDLHTDAQCAPGADKNRTERDQQCVEVGSRDAEGSREGSHAHLGHPFRELVDDL